MIRLLSKYQYCFQSEGTNRAPMIWNAKSKYEINRTVAQGSPLRHRGCAGSGYYRSPSRLRQVSVQWVAPILIPPFISLALLVPRFNILMRAPSRPHEFEYLFKLSPLGSYLLLVFFCLEVFFFRVGREGRKE